MSRQKFSPAGRVRWARLSKGPAFADKEFRSSGARRAGMLYEREMHIEFSRRFDGRYCPGPWIEFEGDNGFKYCQPDGFLLDWEEGRVLIVEFKLKNTEYMCFQLRDLYMPVVRTLLPEFEVSGVAICKNYDCGIQTASPMPLVRTLEEAARRKLSTIKWNLKL
jgi:hypothetical protein